MADRYKIRFEPELSVPNEVFAADGQSFSLYRPVLDEMGRMGAEEWDHRTRRAHELMLEEQRGLGITGPDMTHPTDYVPRLVPATDWAIIERGLVQRMLAINEFLRRLEVGKEEVVPREVIESSVLYDASIPDGFGSVPNRQMGFDLVAVQREGGAQEYLVIEDNAKMPVGIEPMCLMRARNREVLPESYASLRTRSLDGLMQRFGEVLRAGSPGSEPTLAVLSTGPDDQYYLDHNYFARELDAILAQRHEVELTATGTRSTRTAAGG